MKTHNLQCDYPIKIKPKRAIEERYEIINSTFTKRYQIIGGKFNGGVCIDKGKGGEFADGFKILEGVFGDSFIVHDINCSEDFTIEGGIFHKDFIIEKGHFKSIIIKGGKFCGDFIIKTNIEIITIEGGDFLGDFIIEGENVDTNNQLPEIKTNLTIKGGVFQENFTIKSGNFKKLMIDGGSFGGKFSIGTYEHEPATFKEDMLEISSGIFKEKFAIVKGNFQPTVQVSGGTFSKGFEISGGDFQKFIFSGGEISENAVFRGGTFSDEFSISGGNFKKNFLIEGGIYKGKLVIKEPASIDKSFKISQGTFENISVQNGMLNKLEIHPDGRELVDIGSLIIDTFINYNISVTDFFSNEGNNKTIKGEIKQITIKGIILSGGNIYLRNLELNQINLQDLKNDGTLWLTNINPCGIDSLIKIENCNLGTTTFLRVKFSDFGEVNVQSSKLSGISMLRNYVDEIKTTDDRQIKYKALAGIYNQFYLAMQNQGNREQEIKYYARYLKWQHKKFKTELKKPVWKVLRTLERSKKQEIPKRRKKASVLKWLKDLFKYINLIFTSISFTLNKLSTSYGVHWFKGFFGTLVIGAIFFYFYVVSLEEFEMCFCLDFWSWKQFGYYFKYYIQFIFPTHKFDFMVKDLKGNLTGWAAFWDAFGRVFIGFWIYQTIAAFRRFGRK